MPETKYIGLDRLGNKLFDGDKVLSFNIFAENETWPLSASKVGVMCKILWKESRNQPFIIRLGDDCGSTGCKNHADATFGVEKVFE